MRLTLSDPKALPALVAALRAGECLAEETGRNTVDVIFPWLEQPADARQAIVELRFFARTWEATHPGLRILLGLSA